MYLTKEKDILDLQSINQSIDPTTISIIGIFIIIK